MADQPEKSAKIMISVARYKAIIQQLRDSQKRFEITTHNLEEEEEPHAAKYPILPNTAKSESLARKTGPPAPAQFVSETNLSSPAPPTLNKPSHWQVAF
jgi:hypothetical protein